MALSKIVAAFVLALCALTASARPLSAELPAETTFLPTYPNPWDKPYANEKPLIGILTQACHYCPGRYVLGSGGRLSRRSVREQECGGGGARRAGGRRGAGVGGFPLPVRWGVGRRTGADARV